MVMKRSLLAITLFVAILTVTACSVTGGSGNVISKTWEISSFDSIDLSGSGLVIVTQDGSESLTVETDDNLMDYIKAEVDGGTLKLGFKPGANLITPTHLAYYVSADKLVGLKVSGSGDLGSEWIDTSFLDLAVSGSGEIQIAWLQASEVRADISGSGEMDLAGDVAVQAITIGGAGNYLAGDLCSATVKVDVSGSGEATVCATQTLDADISGSGSVGYYGQPTVNASSSGLGSIQSLGEK